MTSTNTRMTSMWMCANPYKSWQKQINVGKWKEKRANRPQSEQIHSKYMYTIIKGNFSIDQILKTLLNELNLIAILRV
jgi:hypothetical protein